MACSKATSASLRDSTVCTGGAASLPLPCTQPMHSRAPLLQTEEDTDMGWDEAPALVPFRVPGSAVRHEGAGGQGVDAKHAASAVANRNDAQGAQSMSEDDEDEIVVLSSSSGRRSSHGRLTRRSVQQGTSAGHPRPPAAQGRSSATQLHSGLEISPEAFSKLRGIDASNARLSTLERHTRGLQIWPDVPNICFPSKRELRYKSRNKIDWEESKRLLQECASVLYDPVRRSQLESLLEVFVLPAGHPAYCPGEEAKGVRSTRDIPIAQFMVIAQYTAILKVKKEDMPEEVQRFAWDAWGENDQKRDCGPQQCQHLCFEATLPHRGTHYVNVNKCPDGKGGSRMWLAAGHNCEPVYVLCRGGCSKPDGGANPVTPDDWHPHLLYMLTRSVSKGEELLLESYGEDYDASFLGEEQEEEEEDADSDIVEVEEEDG